MEIKFPKITDMGKNKIVGFISLKKIFTIPFAYPIWALQLI